MARKNNLKNTDKTKFSSKNQPSKEAKKQGWRKKLVLKDIASQIVQGQAVEDLKPLAIYLGIEEHEIDVETLMHLSQMSKAIKEQDTRAYNAVMDRLKGKPKQEVDHTTNGQPINKVDKVEVAFKDFSDEDISE